jgi:transcriptional regulator with XRE-family HTH domain
MTKGINDLQPARLEQALAARSLSKGQLASLVGVAASTVTKWCKGDQSPEASTFDRLATVLNVQPEWLARPMLKPTSAPFYRSNASALKAARAKLEARTEWTQELAYYFNDYVEFPEVKLAARSWPNSKSCISRRECWHYSC